MNKRLILLLTLMLLIACTPLSHAQDTGYHKVSASFFGTFDTLITLMGYVREDAVFDAVYPQVQAAYTRYHEVYDGYNAHEGVKGLHYLNKHGTAAPVAVEPELLELLLYCREHQPLTRGTVNIAMGALLQVWHEYREAGEFDPATAELPPPALLEKAAGHTNFDDVVIDEAAGTVFLADPQMSLDLGAVAKGYATEQIAQWLLTSEMPSFLLSAGGNVRAGNPPLDGRQRWGVSVQDPNASVFASAEESSRDILFVSNKSVVTSGDYQRFYVVDDLRVHHLISPRTLMPADYFRSVTVVCKDSGLADLLSTAFFLLPYDEGRALADSLDGVDVLWMLNDEGMTLQLTDGLVAMSKNNGAHSSD